MKDVKKQHLPVKTCAVCGRPFAWRRKWALVWDEVKYCSNRCRESRKTSMACLQNGRDGSPQPSGSCKANGTAHEMNGNRIMFAHAPAIHTDRPEVGPCLFAITQKAAKGN